MLLILVLIQNQNNILIQYELIYEDKQDSFNRVVQKTGKSLSSISEVAEYTERGPIEILSNNAFGPTGYNFPGYGNITHPYLIDGYNITDYSMSILIRIESTTSYFKISNCLLNGLDFGVDGLWLYNVVHGTIENNSIYACDDGIYLYESSNNTFSNNTINNCDNGIFTWNSHSNTFNENLIYNCDSSGIPLTASSHNSFFKNTLYNCGNYGIFLSSMSNYNNLSGNTVFNCSDYGVILSSSSNNSLSNNIIYNIEFTDGIWLQTSVNTTLINNTIYDILAGDGIGIMDSNNNLLSSNTIYNCSGNGIILISTRYNFLSTNIIYNCGEDGINFWSSPYNNIFQNKISKCEYYGIRLDTSCNNNTIAASSINECYLGIFLSSSSNNIIRNNNIFNNSDYGIYIIGSSNYNSINWNNFINNIGGGTPQGSDSSTNDLISYNYWDDHTGTDSEPNGIFDNPYTLAGGTRVDPYPLTSPITPNVTIITPIAKIYGTKIITVKLSGNALHYWYFIDTVDSENQTWTISEDRILLIDETYTLHAYGNDSLGNIGYTSVTFTVDSTPPVILLTSPTNDTYTEHEVWLNFTINEPTSWVAYSLDESMNITITDNLTLNFPIDGHHSIVIWAQDFAGSTVKSNVVWFTVDLPLPNIIINSPGNTTYADRDIWLNFTSDEPTEWIGYSLDGANNVTVTGNILLSSLSEGSHQILIYANDSLGSMGKSEFIWFTIDTQPPNLLLTNPINTTYAKHDIWINFTTDEVTSWMAYSLDGSPNVTITGNFILNSLSEGSHSIVLYANDTTGNLGISTVTWFTIDTIAPNITIFSPSNHTYIGEVIWLNFTINEPVIWIGYSLDGIDNITISENLSLGGLLDGSHTIIIYTIDYAGNEGVSSIIWFSTDSMSSSATTATLSTESTTIGSSSTIVTTTSKSSYYTDILSTFLFLSSLIIVIQKRRRK